MQWMRQMSIKRCSPALLIVLAVIAFVFWNNWELVKVMTLSVSLEEAEPPSKQTVSKTATVGSRQPEPTASSSPREERPPQTSEVIHRPEDPPYEYPNEVDLRLIIITYKRSESLQKLLLSIDTLILDQASAALEIWIDYPSEKNKGPFQKREETLKVARAYRWRQGPTTIHIWASNAGLRGQWLNTWRPKSDDSEEIGLILEDDLTLSPYAFRWLRAGFLAYRARRDVSGLTLMSQEVAAASNLAPLKTPDKDMAYGFQWASSWALAPHPAVWRRFQDWYHVVNEDPDFHPHIPDTRTSAWYENAELKNRTHTIWTQMFIYYCYDNKLYCVFNNIGHVVGSEDTLLVLNRKEQGLHSQGNFDDFDEENLLQHWDDRYIHFPRDPVRFDLYGKVCQDKYIP